MCDKERIQKAFEECGIKFQTDRDGDIRVKDSSKGDVFFIFHNDGMFWQVETYEEGVIK